MTLPVLTKETAEVSTSTNWVLQSLKDRGLPLLEFEGYTLKHWTISALLDRLQVDSLDVLHRLNEISWLALASNLDPHLANKIRFAALLQVPYLYMFYDQHSLHTTVRQVYCPKFSYDPHNRLDLEEFIRYLASFRDVKMKATFEETGLPAYDKALRGLGTPWPGNLDGILLDEQGIASCILEFQTTKIATVEAHSNNAWWSSSSGRKGDAGRWLPVQLLHKQSGLPVVIIVWQPGDRKVKLKVVDKFTSKGMYYSLVKLATLDELVHDLNLLRDKSENFMPLLSGFRPEPSMDETPSDS